jgi:Ca2+-transporting ATPase
MSWTNNQLLWLGVGVECAALLIFIYYPPLSNIFTTAPLSVWQWLLLLACPPILLGAEELRKAIFSSFDT